jgi:hypothetical protein
MARGLCLFCSHIVGLFVVHSFEPSFGLTGLKSKNAIIFY